MRIAVGMALLMAAALVGVPSAAQGTPAVADTSVTFTFSGASQSSGVVQTWVVPADVTALLITARGGDGAGDTWPNEDPRKYGGHGAVVTMTSPVTVTPGATLSIYVAGRGDPGRGNNRAGKGGWGYGSGGQGGSGYAGGGGGGASAVESDLDGLLIVAGGGGGAGSERGADGGAAAYLGTAAGQDGLGTAGGGGGADGVGGAAGTPGATGVIATAGQSFAAGGTGGAGAKFATESRDYPFGGGGGGGYGAGGGGGGEARIPPGTTDGGSGGGAGGSFSAVAATFAPSTLPWNPADLRTGHPGEVVITVYQPPVPPPPPVPATDPLEVRARTDDRTATVSWSPPASAGSYAVSTYQVVASPSGRSCLTSSLSCMVTGLPVGEAQSVRVRALTGAGWGAWSAPVEVTSIRLSGVREGRSIALTGSTTGLGMGAIVSVWIDGGRGFRQMRRTTLVSMDGSFEWAKRLKRDVPVRVYATVGETSSNTIRLR